MTINEPVRILPAEYLGEAAHDEKGILRIGQGEHVVEIPLSKAPWPGRPEGCVGWWNTGTVSVYVRRLSTDLSICEIQMVSHDGLASEEMAEEDRQAAIYPLGPKEYWRSKMVGKYTFGADRHPMTDEEFEEEFESWDDDHEEHCPQCCAEGVYDDPTDECDTPE